PELAIPTVRYIASHFGNSNTYFLGGSHIMQQRHIVIGALLLAILVATAGFALRAQPTHAAPGSTYNQMAAHLHGGSSKRMPSGGQQTLPFPSLPNATPIQLKPDPRPTAFVQGPNKPRLSHTAPAAGPVVPTLPNPRSSPLPNTPAPISSNGLNSSSGAFSEA